MANEEQEWKEKLSEEEYRVLREKATERPFTGKYHDFHEEGIYHCAACGSPLFSSDAKFDSGTGWPSFWAPYDENAFYYEEDFSHGMNRIELLCNECDSHIGHVFDDGPHPSGKRFCVNSVCLRFKPEEGEA